MDDFQRMIMIQSLLGTTKIVAFSKDFSINLAHVCKVAKEEKLDDKGNGTGKFENLIFTVDGEVTIVSDAEMQIFRPNWNAHIRASNQLFSMLNTLAPAQTVQAESQETN